MYLIIYLISQLIILFGILITHPIINYVGIKNDRMWRSLLSVYAWEIPIYPPVCSECLFETLSPTADNDCCEPLDLAIFSK